VPLSDHILAIESPFSLYTLLLILTFGQNVYQGAHHSFARARAALKYIVLALSGVMDDILVKYKVIF